MREFRTRILGLLAGSWKKALFYAVLLAPLALLIGLPTYAFFFTNLPQLLYIGSIRNIYADCFEFSDAAYAYKMKPGECKFANIEYDTTLTHDRDGFRNRTLYPELDIALIGDSHTYGFGVDDDETFAALLASRYHYKTRNLGITSYAALRELEALSAYGRDAPYVVIQYCDNDAGENGVSLHMSREDFARLAGTGWKGFLERSLQGKAMGVAKPIQDFFALIKNRSFLSKWTWRKRGAGRYIAPEALSFAQVVDRYRQLLEGKRVLVFEASGHGLNSAMFEADFGSELKKLGWLDFRMIDSAKLLNEGDYYFLDDHLNPRGHRKLADRIASEIQRWEIQGPRLRR